MFRDETMKRFMLATTAMVAATTVAHAGGVERSTQSVAILFEQGRYAELSFGRFAPDVSGTVGGGAVSSGDMAGDYNSWSLGYKMDIGDRMALAFILDQPIGANVNYPAGTRYPLGGSTATLTSSAITALLKYGFENNVSVYGGHTPCVEIRLGERLFIIDAGTGIIPLGRAIAANAPIKSAKFFCATSRPTAM